MGDRHIQGILFIFFLNILILDMGYGNVNSLIEIENSLLFMKQSPYEHDKISILQIKNCAIHDILLANNEFTHFLKTSCGTTYGLPKYLIRFITYFIYVYTNAVSQMIIDVYVHNSSCFDMASSIKVQKVLVARTQQTHHTCRFIFSSFYRK